MENPRSVRKEKDRTGQGKRRTEVEFSVMKRLPDRDYHNTSQVITEKTQDFVKQSKHIA